MAVLRETDPDPSEALRELSPSIDAAIFIDRSSDWVTPMLTMLTYEGLVDETFGIKSCAAACTRSQDALFPADLCPSQPPAANAELPASIANPPPTSGAPSTAATEGKKKHLLNSSDTLFADLRDRNFQVVRHRLSETARRLQSEITEVRVSRPPFALFLSPTLL